jgi:hypothetical protein
LELLKGCDLDLTRSDPRIIPSTLDSRDLAGRYLVSTAVRTAVEDRHPKFMLELGKFAD